ncbi:MAG: M67 family metallopeptidase [Bacteroidales bacterium]|nr:M67 family metallopeptidase [Bacteroidales bacterium]
MAVIYPEEACGLLSGEHDYVRNVFFITNSEHSKSHFFMEPVELLDALSWMDKNSQELMGIFHSHPTGPGEPSKSDIAESQYPGVPYLIFYPGDGEWKVKGFLIEGLDIIRIEIMIE